MKYCIWKLALGYFPQFVVDILCNLSLKKGKNGLEILGMKWKFCIQLATFYNFFFFSAVTMDQTHATAVTTLDPLPSEPPGNSYIF